MKLKRLLPFLLLNILVSALTTLGVLTWWDRTHKSNLPMLPTLAPLTTPTIEVTSTLPPLDMPLIEIKQVIGMGDLKNEAVVLTRKGEGVLEMTGWQLKDDQGHIYTFPKLTLNKDGAVQVYTRLGADTVIELHWNLAQPIWESGKTIHLLDSAGNSRSSLRIP
jgi:hypothetical protein